MGPHRERCTASHLPGSHQFCFLLHEESTVKSLWDPVGSYVGDETGQLNKTYHEEGKVKFNCHFIGHKLLKLPHTNPPKPPNYAWFFIKKGSKSGFSASKEISAWSSL